MPKPKQKKRKVESTPPPRVRWSLEKRICIYIIVAALALGAGFRLVGLQNVPLGFDQDEAVNGYDAYSLALTGNDHHGNFLPVVIQGFNDYRMAMFDYSLVPLVSVFGLKAWVVRAGAALWGILDIVAITALAGVMFGMYGAAAAALLAAFSPWHLPWSRFGVEVTVAMAVVDLAILCFLLWTRSRRSAWLTASGALFGLSFYTYAVSKAFTPLMVLLLCALYWREIIAAWRNAAVALALAALIALPQGIFLLRHVAESQARYENQSLFTYINRKDKGFPVLSNLQVAELLGANLAAYFTPSYLFVAGDRGDHWTMPHPVGFGMLLPEQALLIALALVAFIEPRRRKIAILLVGWLVIAAVPPALTTPMGAIQPDVGAAIDAVPSPWALSNWDFPLVPFTPALLMAHPMSRRNLFGCTPWILLSALGVLTLMEHLPDRPRLRNIALGALGVGVLFSGARFVKYYFTQYPIIAAPYFQYGIDQALAAAHKLNDGNEFTILSWRINQPYIYALFYDQYDPAEFQRETILRVREIFGPVVRFDHYIFYKPYLSYQTVDHGVVIFTEAETPPARAAAIISYPNGNTAYSVVAK